MHLHVHLRIGAVHHMEDHITVPRFFKRTLECLDKVMRKLPDKSDRIRQKDLLPTRKHKRSRRRIQSCKELIFRQDPGSCQFI